MYVKNSELIFSGHSHGGGGGHGHSHGNHGNKDKNPSNNVDSKSLLQKPSVPSQNAEEYDENNPVWEINPESKENSKEENDPNEIVIEFDEKRFCKYRDVSSWFIIVICGSIILTFWVLWSRSRKFSF